jgi:hypothetical protein
MGKLESVVQIEPHNDGHWDYPQLAKQFEDLCQDLPNKYDANKYDHLVIVDNSRVRC